ncbi:MAG TPA: DUF1874 domain-containing protein [Alphaproteobacteria bacterium]|nr:DUF1874 domain-containing protein [Alphaproteobacteria bacterium]
MRYILNSAVVTAPGHYEYRSSRAVDHAWSYRLDEAAAWLAEPGWISTVGYAETAAAMSELFGVEIPVDRRTITMHPGDEALVFRLVFPAGYRPDPATKGQLGAAFIREHCEVGLLRRLA